MGPTSNKLVGADLVRLCVAIVYYCCLNTPSDYRKKNTFEFCGAKKRAARSNAAKGSFDRRQGLKNPCGKHGGVAFDTSLVS